VSINGVSFRNICLALCRAFLNSNARGFLEINFLAFSVQCFRESDGRVQATSSTPFWACGLFGMISLSKGARARGIPICIRALRCTLLHGVTLALLPRACALEESHCVILDPLQ
jgi:hypothetical protein